MLRGPHLRTSAHGEGPKLFTDTLTLMAAVQGKLRAPPLRWTRQGDGAVLSPGWERGCSHSYLRCLEEEDPPVGCLQLQHIGLLAVVGGPGGQSMVHTNGVLQVALRQGFVRPVLILDRPGRGWASLCHHQALAYRPVLPPPSLSLPFALLSVPVHPTIIQAAATLMPCPPQQDSPGTPPQLVSEA